MIERVLAAALLVAAACSEQATGSADTPVSFAVRGRQADPTGLRYAVESGEGPLAAAEFAAAIDRAAATWNATGVVGLVRASEPGAADVILGWRRGRHGSCEPFGNTHAFAHSGPVATPTFVHFDAAREWNGASGKGLSLEAIALHELGHVLGLGHSEDPEAVMSSAPREGTRGKALAPADLAGIHSLYGGGDANPSDVVVRDAQGNELAVLRRAAPKSTTDVTAQDLDGDGRAEVCIYRTDAAGHGALVGFAFTREGRLERTLGPYLGLGFAGARVRPATATNGARLLVTELPNGRLVAHQFDAHALASPWLGPVPEYAGPIESGRAVADLTGDGIAESVERRVR